MLSVSPLFLVLVISVAAFDETPFAIPVFEGLGVEYYDNGETRFAIFMQKVDWQEARQLCHSRGGGLIEYLKEEDHRFIGRALAESAVGFASLWIGGEYVPASSAQEEGMWRWTQSGEPIDSKLANVKKFPMTSPPYWVDRPDSKGTSHICLATDRNSHNDALIVGEPCDRKRPYICKLPSGANGTVDPTQPLTPPVNIEGKEFHLFTSLTTWDNALLQCRSYGMTLAKVTTEAEFRILNNKMLRIRPVMETAWIGGMVESGKWVWVGFHEPININKNHIKPGYPFAWNQPDHIIMEGCLLADRHLCDHLVFVEAKCDRKRSYICEKEKTGVKKTPSLVPVPGTDYYISSKEEEWEKAQNICRVCLGGDLLRLESTKQGVAEQLSMLYTAMALTLQTEIRHIWVGGYLFGDTFKWTDSPQKNPIGDERALNTKLYDGLQASGENGRLIFCEVAPNMKAFVRAYKCLNLDRDNQKYFSLYGLKCYVAQHFICKAAEGAELEPSCAHSGVIQLPNNTITGPRMRKPSTTETPIVSTDSGDGEVGSVETTTSTTETPIVSTHSADGEVGSVETTTSTTETPIVSTDSGNGEVGSVETTTSTTETPIVSTDSADGEVGSVEATTSTTETPIVSTHSADGEVGSVEATTSTTETPIVSTDSGDGEVGSVEATTSNSSADQSTTAPMAALWVRVNSYTDHWINVHPATWKSAKKSCKDCLNGELLLIKTFKKKQGEQLKMINEAMTNTIDMHKTRLWLGHIRLDDESVFEDHPDSDGSKAKRSKKEFDEVRPYREDTRMGLSPRCAALNWRGRDIHIMEDRCIYKRHTICHTKPDATLDKICGEEQDPDGEEEAD